MYKGLKIGNCWSYRHTLGVWCSILHSMDDKVIVHFLFSLLIWPKQQYYPSFYDHAHLSCQYWLVYVQAIQITTIHPHQLCYVSTMNVPKYSLAICYLCRCQCLWRAAIKNMSTEIVDSISSYTCCRSLTENSYTDAIGLVLDIAVVKSGFLKIYLS